MINEKEASKTFPLELTEEELDYYIPDVLEKLCDLRNPI